MWAFDLRVYILGLANLNAVSYEYCDYNNKKII